MNLYTYNAFTIIYCVSAIVSQVSDLCNGYVLQVQGIHFSELLRLERFLGRPPNPTGSSKLCQSTNNYFLY